MAKKDKTEARTRATRQWRERTQQKLVQVYLHADTVAKLDQLVSEEDASGRAAVIGRLINSAVVSLDSESNKDAETTTELVELPRHDDRCMAMTTRGPRCRSKGVWWRPVVIDGNRWDALVCKTHQRAEIVTVHGSQWPA